MSVGLESLVATERDVGFADVGIVKFEILMLCWVRGLKIALLSD